MSDRIVLKFELECSQLFFRGSSFYSDNFNILSLFRLQAQNFNFGLGGMKFKFYSNTRVIE